MSGDHSHSHAASPANDPVLSTRPRRQEQEDASTEIIEVAPGVLRSQLPISLPGLGHVNCYLIEDGDGVALVDPGLPTKASYAALVARLATAGIPLRRVHTVIVTHSHPDHFGGAHRLRAETGARIVAHRSFRIMWDPREPPDTDVESTVPPALLGVERPRRRYPWETTPWGGAGMAVPWRRRAQIKVVRRFPPLMRLPRPTHRLADAETIRLGGRDWVAIHTPGHTDDHLCLFEPESGTMLSGDHVLPTITPHISGLIAEPDPLQRFFDSLDRVATFAATTVLPAHGHPFVDLSGRVEAIKRHHDERLQRLRDSSAERGVAASVADFSTVLFSPRVQGAMADSETFAHLEHLRLAGEAEAAWDDGVLKYRVSATR